MNKLKNEKGITLISLVITIVVLTIIAIITISVSNVNNELIGETIKTTKQSQVNKYRELIEITRQEALSREYALEIKAKEEGESTVDLVLQAMKTIMETSNEEYYRNAQNISELEVTTVADGESYIELITAEGYRFHITKTETSLQS